MIAALCLLPSLTYAAEHNVVSFKPSPGDLSMTFLENIFGVVDGVLAGTGSQILGAMFGVFNSAVIALGGIILVYMLLVSTLNMSNEGQLLGQKWSTLWVPMRSALGVGLLLPQASGYCVIQIFIMFVVVQGIGAADSVWSSALGYLNRGGVIMQKQIIPGKASGSNGVIMDAAMGIIVGQVCMQALNVKYESLRQTELKGANCTTAASGSDWEKFCQTEVPNFMASVNIISPKNLTSQDDLDYIKQLNEYNKVGKDLLADLIMAQSASSEAQTVYNNALSSYQAQQAEVSTMEGKKVAAYNDYITTISNGYRKKKKRFKKTNRYRKRKFDANVANKLAIYIQTGPNIKAAQLDEAVALTYSGAKQQELAISLGETRTALKAYNDHLADPPTSPPYSTIEQQMPYFGDPDAIDASLYTKINGICGRLDWDPYQPTNPDPTLTSSEQATMSNSRTIAVGQMYSALQLVSTAMIMNAPKFNSSIDCSRLFDTNNIAINTCHDPSYAKDIFGYPLNKRYDSDCKGGTQVLYSDESACTDWGVTTETAILFTGRELLDAVASYNGIMMPTLTSDELNNTSNQQNYDEMRSFIREAQNKGWIMAGAYFFRLALLNNYVLFKTGSDGVATDSRSGLKFSKEKVTDSNSTAPWSFAPIKEALQSKTVGTDQKCLNDQIYMYQPLCHLSYDAVDSVGTFISGVGDTNFAKQMPVYTDTISTENYFNSGDVNVYTFVINENSLVLPTQTTILDAGLKDANIAGFNPDQSVQELSKMSFPGGKWGISGAVSGFLWNDLMRPVFNYIIKLIMPPIMELFSAMLSPIISTSAIIFNAGLDVMRIEGVNPILAIAEMGVQFIEGVGNSWITMLLYVVAASIFPPAFALIMMLMPLVTSWMGIMLTVGFSAAFYVPFIPLLVFTFASIGWLIAVMEGMVAAPIIALGVLHPEGENEAFGKADQAWLLLLNMFLRPALMIMGYIFGIAFSYVGVWVMNAGFNMTLKDITHLTPINSDNIVPEITTDKEKTMYGFWTNVLLFYFSILTYTTLYVSIVQQAFEMIHYLPDKILRWVAGGRAESLGEGTVKPMIQEVKSASDDAASESSSAVGKANSGINKTLSGDKMDDKNNEVDDKKEEGSDAS